MSKRRYYHCNHCNWQQPEHMRDQNRHFFDRMAHSMIHGYVFTIIGRGDRGSFVWNRDEMEGHFSVR